MPPIAYSSQQRIAFILEVAATVVAPQTAASAVAGLRSRYMQKQHAVQPVKYKRQELLHRMCSKLEQAGQPCGKHSSGSSAQHTVDTWTHGWLVSRLKEAACIAFRLACTYTTLCGRLYCVCSTSEHQASCVACCVCCALFAVLHCTLHVSLCLRHVLSCCVCSVALHCVRLHVLWQVRRESRNQAAAAARLSAIEDKLAVLEGAMVGAGGHAAGHSPRF